MIHAREAARGVTLLERIISAACSDKTIPQIAREAGASYQRTYAVVRECDLPFRRASRGRPVLWRNSERRAG